MKPAVVALKYFDASISHMLIVTKLKVQKKKKIMNHFFAVASPGKKTKLSLDQEASVTS